eukprot:gnl/MRDRNA2_/MRDRNA2_108117_c0_seq1.p1 gnl/MRDRNA2_/MRDRNA2_108117_c0~~gnl/MRDRNA2_/MRDRNA2_108117_c0_seq1.p1  ORF type:complete len:137 (-),score=38.61 gnl/MRDRNA2_/MRDRNA2_108117_c0_seq1:27-437(-)
MPEGDAPKVKNLVHDMEVWKQRVAGELAVQKNWDNTWGFLKSEQKEDALSSEDKEMPKGIEKMLRGEGKEEDPNVPPKFKQRLDQMKPPKDRFAHPVTTQQEVGWHKPIELFGVNQHGRRACPDLWAEKNPHQHKF